MVIRPMALQQLLKSIMEKLRSPSVVLKVPVLIKAVLNNVETNLSFSDLLVIADELRNFDLTNFRIQKIPGEPIIRWRKSYWKVN